MRKEASMVYTLVALVAGCAMQLTAAQPQPPTQPALASSRISAVTVYQTSALVSREVDVPAGAGIVELLVGPLPASTVNSSLYSEGTNGLRVLTTRFRTRVLQENMEEEVRKLENELKELKKLEQDLQKQVQTIEQNQALLAKLEDFTAGALKQITEKGMLNAEAVTSLAKFIMETRAAKSQELVGLQQKIQANQEQMQYVQRQMSKVASTSDKTVREAVIVVDNEQGAAARVRLNYLVSAASWRPQYKLRAGKAAEDVQLEYLGAINQQTGEDWRNVDLVLSTAQPLLNAAPPELAMLEISTAARAIPASAIGVNGGKLNFKSDDNLRQARQIQQEAQMLANAMQKADAQQRFNDAAAWVQSDEIMNPDALAAVRGGRPAPVFREGQSVTFHLERRLTIPWRDDEQLVEVARIAMKPDYFYKAIPVLTPHVYRLANLVNESKYVILPGEATMYTGTDFVGRATLPLVAIGEQFTAGFGVDPQLQVTRSLVDKNKSLQGGNQVHRFDYRITVSSYKTEPAKLQVWDRLPHSETEAVNVTLVSTGRELSTEPAYVREEKPKNLLRWDLSVEPGTKGEKAIMITYQYKLEFAREASIDKFMSK